jgi:trimethylamine:corrinoid methyltransferase-like protein
LSRGGRIKAVLTLNHVNGRYRRGRLSTPEKLREAIDDVDSAVLALKGLEVTPLRLGDIARAHQLASSLFTELGQHDRAIDRMAAAHELFEEAGASGLDYGRFLHDFAVRC